MNGAVSRVSETGPTLATLVEPVARRRHRSIQSKVQQDPIDPIRVLHRRARRWAAKGNTRKAALVLREVVRATGEPAAWVAFGSMLIQAQRREQALDALRQGLWLHRQRGAIGRARTVAKMILDLDPLDPKAGRILARA
jgi:hypothetical protein